MAHIERVAAQQEIILVCESADPQATGNQASFAHPIRAIIVDDPANYKITMVEITYTAPGATPVYVSCNLVDRTRVGSQNVNILYRCPDTPAGAIHLIQNASVVQWRPYAALREANQVEIQLTNAAGQLIAAAGTTSVTLAIRRI